MAQETKDRLKDRLARVIEKSNVLVEKYQALSQSHASLSEQLEQQAKEIAELKAQVEKLEKMNYYLRMTQDVAPNPEQVNLTRSMISKLVRDIDKCIAQLNA